MTEKFIILMISLKHY